MFLSRGNYFANNPHTLPKSFAKNLKSIGLYKFHDFFHFNPLIAKDELSRPGNSDLFIVLDPKKGT